ncbi:MULTISPECIES: universal stress protein [Roseobacter]|uniref:universal stress protein n=1 Tax=Roseobacter TaxID=2433 RepID=UPI001BBF6D06|nr:MULTISPECIES: universal stress protein [Roseobacter]GIT88566.1 universal stress protein UspA [Roseobacter sp. OBYS 0001]
MTNHILCSVDLTHEDEAAKLLREAYNLAGFYGATLSVVTVLPDYGSSWVGSFFKEGTMHDAAEAANEALHKLVSDTLPQAEGVQHIVEIGVVYEKVLEAIALSHADLVIVGAHKPDLADRFMGPNAARIARHAGISTLVLRV